MKKILFLVGFFVSVTAFAAAPVGQVVDVVGDVIVTQEGKTPVAPTLKQLVYMGDIIETKKTGGLKILFKDDTVLTVKENSKTLITEFLFDTKKNERKAVFNVVYGKIRAVVGRFFGENQPVEIKTPTAVGGIRGTDVAAVVKKCDAKKSISSCQTSFYCFNGKFYVANIDRPEKEIQVAEGAFTQILGNNDPLPVAPIPPDILRTNGIIFDISLTSPSGGSSQLATLTTSGVDSQATQDSAVTFMAEADSSIFDSASEADSAESALIDASPTAASDLGVQILPGGVTQATNTITINIVLP
ncbi:MAG: FecR domain-containing protein [Deltaproteobacteria bacterium]|nr:FecR domain-containing protein [Deltaproteobacteria bacterium]